MQLLLDPNNLNDYRTFLRVKSLPRFRVVGRTVEFPDEYASAVGIVVSPSRNADYSPLPSLFDYQRDLSRLAIRKKKYAMFLQCGYGKTLILLEFARFVADLFPDRPFLIVSPLMVVRQTIAEAKRFYGDSLPIQQIRAAELPAFTEAGRGIGITNYEAIGLRQVGATIDRNGCRAGIQALLDRNASAERSD